MNTEKLFSYGTLQYESVQLANFGRKLVGVPDTLLGFKLSMLRISDAQVIATSGEAEHPVVIYTGDKADRVDGVVFEVSGDELQEADAYEDGDYKRIGIQLASGTLAWVYVGANYLESSQKYID